MLAVLGLLLPVMSFSFALGLTLPLLRMERLYFLQDTPSLLEVITGLFAEGDQALALVIFLFSVLLPGLKIVVLHLACLQRRAGWALKALSTLGKWSMMDVMLVALVIFATKTSGLATASGLPGLWFYGAAALLSAVSAPLCLRAVRTS
ncbi:paraquat-inducible protein A [Pseudovibrio sp. SPO723]|uniref:paraquat-inducible protein A n=1 Tax=Nesiotobacter zosterae TaxID=392721 RepID=UPI0029C45040|nr:paraquat-inducible protein A [Pseudovibrio sp. SPO723]MDX5595383.1 paraquat-inducible protein A [Pseudovibrio sp. SPO723]